MVIIAPMPSHRLRSLRLDKHSSFTFRDAFPAGRRHRCLRRGRFPGHCGQWTSTTTTRQPAGQWLRSDPPTRHGLLLLRLRAWGSKRRHARFQQLMAEISLCSLLGFVRHSKGKASTLIQTTVPRGGSGRERMEKN